MRIDFTGRHVQVEDGLREHAEKKIEKILRFLDEPIETQIIVWEEKMHQVAEIHISHRHGILQAKEEGETQLDAFNVALEKVEKQARRSRKKLVDKRRRAARDGQHWPLDVIEGPSLGSVDGPRVVKSGRLPIKPMTIDEAALELERSKNDFFVFLDSGTEKVSVLYRRRDQNFGLIAPEP